MSDRRDVPTEAGTAKKARTSLVTPMHGHSDQRHAVGIISTPAEAAPTGDILDYLKGRGGKIKELEEQVAELHSLNDSLLAQLAASEQRHAGQHGSQHGIDAEFQPQLPYAEELESLLKTQLERVLALENEAAVREERLVDAEQRALRAEHMLLEAQAEAAATAKAAAQQAAHTERQAAAAAAEAAQLITQAHAKVQLELARCTSEAEVHRMTRASLEASHQRLQQSEQEAMDLRTQLSQVQTALASAPVLSPAFAESQSDQVQKLQATIALQQAKLAAQLGHATQQPTVAPYIPTDQLAESSAYSGSHVTALQQQLRATQQELAGWRTAITALVLHEVASPEEAQALLVAHASELVGMRAQLQAAEVALIEQRAQAEHATTSAITTAQALAMARAEAATALTEQRIAQCRLEVVTQERSSLRNALAATLPGSDGQPDSVGARLAAAQAASRLALAEAQVLHLNSTLQTTQDELGTISIREAELRSTAEAASARATQAEARVKRLETEADGLAREVATLQEKLGRGEFHRSANVRVLHLRMNPETNLTREAAQDELGTLRAEVTALRSGLQSMEVSLREAEARAPTALGTSSACAAESLCTSLGGGDNAALQSNIAVRDAEVAVLRHRLTEADRAAVRLREVFRERAAAFREAVYALFGYRVDMTSEATTASAAGSAPTTYNLRPQHADSPDAVLVFRSTAESGMQLVPTPYTQGHLAREIETFVNRFHCIPALTANLTMESFQRQTQC